MHHSCASTFFVGSTKWGIRLNEVAYGCGCDYRNIAIDGAVYNDAQAVAQILSEGMQVCQKCYPPEYFLSRLGMFGPSYAQASISRLKNSLRPPLPKGALDQEAEALSTRNCLDCSVPDHLCKTLQSPCNETRVPMQSICDETRAASSSSRTNHRALSPDLGRVSRRALSPSLGRCRLPGGLERQRQCTSPDAGRCLQGRTGRSRNMSTGGYPVRPSFLIG